MDLLPFAVVTFAAIMLVFFEALRTFERNLLAMLCNRWGWTLLAINILVALGVYLLARTTFDVDNGWRTALLVGLSFPILLRSRFTYFRAVGSNESDWPNALSLQLDEAYSRLQGLCLTAVNSALADKRTAQADRLIALYTTDNLIEILERQIEARPVDIGGAKAKDQQAVNEAKLSPDEGKRAFYLALLLLDMHPEVAKRMICAKGRTPPSPLSPT